jgi:protein TonB
MAVPLSTATAPAARTLAPANSLQPEAELAGDHALAKPGALSAAAPSQSTDAAKTKTAVSSEESLPSASGVSSIPNSDVDYKAAYLHNPKPAYPPMAFKLRLQGEVLVRVEVTEAGTPGRISLARSSGYASLDGAVLETVPKWHFKPAHHDGAAVRQTVVIPVSFKLVKPNGAEAQ